MFISVIDHKNLDNPLFLKSFAEALKQFPPQRSVILHRDSAYTERLIQTGMLREDAEMRAIKDLNHRLVTFLADYGIACIGLNGFQRKAVIIGEKGEIEIKDNLFNTFPDRTVVVLSTLIYDKKTNRNFAANLPEVANALKKALRITEIHLFSPESSDQILIKKPDEGVNSVKNGQNLSDNDLQRLPYAFKGTRGTYILSKPLYNNSLKSFEIITTFDQN